MKIGSLFSGAGGLDMAVEDVFGGTVIWNCELDAAASKVLAHRFPDVPNLGDITAVDWTHVEPVDILCGGFPCQDVSAAGRRAGIKDGTRSGLWAIFADAIAALQPRYVVIENVRGLLNAAAHRPMELQPDALGDRDAQPVLRAIGAVLGDLSDLRYDAQWATVSAASVGAPHRRERVFIVATPADASEAGRGPGRRDAEPSRNRQRATATELGGLAADAAERGGEPSPDASGERHGRRQDSRMVGRLDRENENENRQRQRTRQLPSHRSATDTKSVDLLPTPGAADGNGGKQRSQEALDGLRGKRQCDLPNIARLLPTPQAFDRIDHVRTTEELAKRTAGGGPAKNLRETVVNELLPTPNASDCTGGGAHPDKRKGHSQQLIDYVLAPEQWGKYSPAIHRWENLTRRAPSPTEPNKNGNPRLAATFSEWLMGWPAGWVTEVPGISRNDALRIVGNGVCPQQARAALLSLLALEKTHV